MAALGDETEDPAIELEYLKILSLADDADEEFMEDVMVKEAEPFDVKEFHHPTTEKLMLYSNIFCSISGVK